MVWRCFFFISSSLESKILTLNMRSEVIHCALCSSVLGTAGVHVSQAVLHLSSNAHSITKFISRSLFLVGTKSLPWGARGHRQGARHEMPDHGGTVQVTWKPKTSQHTSELLPLRILLWNRVSVFFIFFSFTSNILSGRGDIAHKYHKSTTYYFHWKLIFYIRYDWIGWNDAGLEDIIPYTAADRHKHHSEQERGVSCFSTAVGRLRTARCLRCGCGKARLQTVAGVRAAERSLPQGSCVSSSTRACVRECGEASS